MILLDARFIGLSLAGSVAAYVVWWRGLVLGDVDLAVCLVALGLAVWLVSGHAGHGGHREGFFDSVKSIVDDVLSPSIDKLVTGLSGKNPDGSTPPTPPPERSVKIGPDHFPDATDTSDAATLQLQYKRIGYLLCRFNEVFPDRYAALKESWGVDSASSSSSSSSGGDGGGGLDSDTSKQLGL